MKLTDSHCHLSKEHYENIEMVVKEAKSKGVNRYVVSGFDNDSNLEILSLINKFPEIYGTLGIHPHSALDYNEEWLNEIEKNIEYKKIVALGEIGLDYYYGKETMSEQKVLFHKQLKIAERLKKPVVIHSREATEDTINILKQYDLKGVIHSLSGSYETAIIYIKMLFIVMK